MGLEVQPQKTLKRIAPANQSGRVSNSVNDGAGAVESSLHMHIQDKDEEPIHINYRINHICDAFDFFFLFFFFNSRIVESFAK